MKIKLNYVKLSFILFLSLFGCSTKINPNNDFFDNLIYKDALYESFDEYIKREKIELETMNFQSNYKKYSKERLLKPHGKIYVSTNEKLILDLNLKESLRTEGYTTINSKLYDDIVNLRINSKYDIEKLPIDINIKDENFIAVVNFSDFIFNEGEDKAVFLFEFFCGNKCYKKQIIYIVKSISGKWEINKKDEIEIS